MAKGHWIQRAIKHPGAFTRAAKRRGTSVAKLAARVRKNPKAYSPKLRRQAALARTLSRLRRH